MSFPENCQQNIRKYNTKDIYWIVLSNITGVFQVSDHGTMIQMLIIESRNEPQIQYLNCFEQSDYSVERKNKNYSEIVDIMGRRRASNAVCTAIMSFMAIP